jgi:hypothetical protein
MAIMDLVTTTATRALPQPMQNGYTEENYHKGTAHRMADGSLVREAVASGRKMRITIEWTQLTGTQRDVVNNAVADMLDGSQATFTPPSGSNLTVVLGEGALPTWTVRKRLGTTTYFYSGKLTLEQV